MVYRPCLGGTDPEAASDAHVAATTAPIPITVAVSATQRRRGECPWTPVEADTCAAMAGSGTAPRRSVSFMGRPPLVPEPGGGGASPWVVFSQYA